MVAAVERVKQEAVAGAVNLSRILRSIANDVVCSAALGKKYSEEYYDLIQEQTDIGAVFHMSDVLPAFRWLSKLAGLDARMDRQFMRWEEFLGKVIHDRLHERSSSEDARPERDFLDVMLSRLHHDGSTSGDFTLTEDNIKAIIIVNISELKP